MKFLSGPSIALLAVTTLQPFVANAAITVEEVIEDQRIMVIQGDFEHGQDLNPIFARIEVFAPDAVAFESPGGNVYAAMEMGRFLRRNQVTTIQPRFLECASACALAFIGGAFRFAEPGSIGVHKSSFSIDGEASLQVSAIQSATADVLSYLREMGVDAGFLETALRYESYDMRYLSASEMEEYGVTSDGPTLVSSPRPTPPPPTPLQAQEQVQATLGTVLHPGNVIDVRSSPEPTGTSLGVIGNGTRVSILELSDNWYRIATQSGGGYVPASAVKVDGFYEAGDGRRFVQVLSLRSQEALQDYLRTTATDGKRCPTPTFPHVASHEIPHGLRSARELLHGRSNGASHKRREAASQPAVAR